MHDVLLPGIAATTVATSRLTQSRAAPRGGRPGGAGGGRPLRARQLQLGAVLAAAAAGRSGPTGRHRVLAVDLRGTARPSRCRSTRPEACATGPTTSPRWSTRSASTRVHLVGWSMGAGVVLQYLLDAPERVASVALVAPVSPYGFGGTAGPDGARVHPDGTGSGAGAANPEFVAAIGAGDTTADDRPARASSCGRSTSLPGSLPLDPQLEDVFVASMNSTRTGADHYPGEPVTVDAWPGRGPGCPRGAQHDGADGLRRLGHRRPGREAAGAVDPRRRRPDRLRHLGVRPGVPRLGRRGAGLAGRGRLPAAADGHPDAHGAGPLRRDRAAPTARSCCPTSGTPRTSSGRTSSPSRCWSTSTSPPRRPPTSPELSVRGVGQSRRGPRRSAERLGEALVGHVLVDHAAAEVGVVGAPGRSARARTGR